jgi:hypothetical protein
MMKHHSGAAPSEAAESILSRSARLDDVPLRLDVAGLRRHGPTASLDLRLVNRALSGGDAFSIGDTFSRRGYYGHVDGILMIDPLAGRELDPLDDGTDVGVAEIGGGGSQLLSVSFPAPRGPKVDLLIPHFGLFRGVPVH